MKITNKQAIETINALAGMGDKVLPIRLSYAIGKNLERLQSEIYRPYDRERVKIIHKYTVLDENGNQKLDAHNRPIFTDRQAYEDELNALLEIENNIEMHTVSEELLEQCEKEEKYACLTMKEIVTIMKMLKE